MPDQKKPSKSDAAKPKVTPTDTRRFRRLSAKAMRRSGGRCEWVRTDVNLRCARPPARVELTKQDGDVSLANMRALCEFHLLMAERSREVARFIAIKVRPPREDG